ncbi:LysR family transcriptional regulator [Litorisediminicola beolgyonensis]|uniref:LysR family transcriptional regulator n=1 Tax=Litorisediminicola beolgyonensis TaxID=1173614 RepID=A0ABW3ZHW4_9RHOB
MNFTNFDLNLLRILDALLATGSTTEAGRKLGLSQPAVSAALGRLRHALSDPLFLRQGRGLVPTDFAAGLQEPLRRLLEEAETLLSPERFDPLQTEARFKLSGADFFAELLVPQLGDRLQRRAPGIRVQLVDLVPDSYVDTIERYQVDMAFIPNMSFPDWIAHQPLFRSPFVTVASQNNARLRRAGIAPGDTIPLDLYCDMAHVLFSPEGNMTAMGDAALARLGRKRKVAMTMPFFSGVAGAVARSEMIALLPVQYANHVADRIGLALYRQPMPVPVATVSMIWHRRSTENPAHRWLREQIADLTAPLDAGTDAP